MYSRSRDLSWELGVNGVGVNLIVTITYCFYIKLGSDDGCPTWVMLYNAWPGVLEAFLFDTYFKAMNSLKESQAMNLFVINTENHKQSSFNISSARLQSMNHWMYAQRTVRVSECELLT